MAKVYRVTGKPAGAPVDLLHSRAVGDEFQAELDKDVERTLIDAGALAIVKHSVKTDKDDAPAESEPEEDRPKASGGTSE